MIYTKTEILILELFCSRITETFTIREISRMTEKDLKIVHTAVKLLLEKNQLVKQKVGFSFDYRKNIQDISYIENLRKEKFLNKHKLIGIYTDKLVKESSNKQFSLVLFGSYASGKEKVHSDIDMMLISDDEKMEKQLKVSFSLLNKNLHIHAISQIGFIDMIHKRDEANIVNECLNNHVILFGSEQFYALLGERDFR